MSTLFSTVAKISKLEQMARDASASSSSDSSTSSLGTLMKAAALNPWFQEARYIIEQQRAAAAAAVASATSHKEECAETSQQHSPTEAHPRPDAAGSPTKATSAVAIFQSHQGANGEGHYVDYNSPQPVFLAPFAGFTAAAATHAPGPSPNSVHASTPPNDRGNLVPINMSLISTRRGSGSAEKPSGPGGGYQAICTTAGAIFLGKSSHHYFTQSGMGSRSSEREQIEDRMAAEEEADAKEASEMDDAAYEPYHCGLVFEIILVIVRARHIER